MIKVKPIANLAKAREVLLVWPGISEIEAKTNPGKVVAR
jgi:hypothetical protein